MKYFKKQALYGVPKSDIERVMTHYNVSRDKALELLKTKSIEDLLPERGANLRR